MCDDCRIDPLNSYTEFDGTVWYYRCRDWKHIERSLDSSTWKEITDEDLAEMSENHMQYVESLLIPF
jgi:hypothetical protein